MFPIMINKEIMDINASRFNIAANNVPTTTCSYTAANSLVTGCLSSVQELTTNPGAQGCHCRSNNLRVNRKQS